MWQLYQTAKATASRPSSLVEIEDRWAALQFDHAVTLVGIVIENAAQEQVNTGDERRPRWTRKYTMRQLLDPAFRLPLEDEGGVEGLETMDGVIFDEV